jgi:hypothetical protein
MRCDDCQGSGRRPTYDRRQVGAVVGIRCRFCGLTSYNLRDVEELYCGHCHRFHDPDGYPCTTCGGSGIISCCDGVVG